MKTRVSLIFTVVTFAPIFVAAQNQPSTAQSRQNAQQANPPAPISVNCDCTNKAEDSKNQPQGWHKFVTWPEGIATWALIFTLGAIVWQAVEVRRSVNAAKESADAALKNAEAVINAERAWLTVEMAPFAKKKGGKWFRWIGGGQLALMDSVTILKGEHLQHGLKFVNMGRTVAHICAYEFHCGFWDHKTETLQIESISYNGDYNHMLGAGSDAPPADLDEVPRSFAFVGIAHIMGEEAISHNSPR